MPAKNHAKEKLVGFRDYVLNDLLGEMPGVNSRAMFGGYGIYQRGIIFAIIAEGRLYFKVGERNLADYEKHGMYPFTYTRPNGKTYAMSYWLVPEEILEDHEEVLRWAMAAVAEASVKKIKKVKK